MREGIPGADCAYKVTTHDIDAAGRVGSNTPSDLDGNAVTTDP